MRGGRVEQHWRCREKQRSKNGHCVAGTVIAKGMRECRGIVNENDKKLLF